MFKLLVFISQLLALVYSQQNGNGNWEKVSLAGTHCLDGTEGVYYLREPMVPPSSGGTLVVYFEGGGWCYGDANCYSRSLGNLGSSKDYPTLPPNVLPPGVSYEGASMFTSTHFINATIAYAKYCSGDSWTGNNATATYFNNTRIYYEGRHMLDTLFTTLQPLFSKVTSVLISGCSAGGLTAYLHADYLATFLPPPPSTPTLLALADAMFVLNVSAYPGGSTSTYLRGMYSWGYTAWNASSSLNADCLAHYGVENGVACMYGALVAPFVQTPLMVANSKFDTWQEVSTMGLNTTQCPARVEANGSITLCLPQYPAQEAFWVAYGEVLEAAAAALPPRHGVFLTNCPVHCQTGVGWGDPSNGGDTPTLGEAVDIWWPLALAHSREPGWAAPRFMASSSAGCLVGNSTAKCSGGDGGEVKGWKGLSPGQVRLEGGVGSYEGPNPHFPGTLITHIWPPTTLPSLAAFVDPTFAVARVLCVVDGHAVLPATPPPATAAPGDAWRCDLGFLSFGGMHWVAAYGIPPQGGGGSPTLLGQPLVLTREAPSGLGATAQAVAQLAVHTSALSAATPPGTAALGVYYTTYLNPLAQLYQNITRLTGLTRTTETLLKDPSLRLSDSVWGPGASAASPPWRNYSATCDLMHQEPALGMYCLYRRRGNESGGLIPDCPETSRVLHSHAALLTAAGFDFVAPDATNFDGDPRTPPTPGTSSPGGSDFYQLRPTEIMGEEWAAGRLAGVATPQLSIFAMVNKGGSLWRWYMDGIFNNQTLLDLGLVFTDRASGRKVFIAADLGNKTDYGAVAEIELNGGRNDTLAPLMWFAPTADGSWEASGRLAYFSRCIGVHEEGGGGVDFTTDQWLDPATPCGHRKTPTSPVGPSWTVSTGLSLNSVPWGAVRFNGLLLKKQWWDVLADPLPTSLLFAPSWNEFGSRAYNLTQLVGATNPAFYAAGTAANDPHRFVLFEDGYGSQRSRTIEPSVEDGGRFYAAFASCVRVYRLQAALGIVSNGTGCDVVGEECCTVRPDEAFVHAWSVDLHPASDGVGGGEGGGGGGGDGGAQKLGTPSDSLLTSDPGELARLGEQGWVQVCVPTIFGRGPTATCVDPTLPFTSGDAGVDAVSRGPFALLANTSGDAMPGLVPLVRCLQEGTGLHFAANSTGCQGGGGHAEVVLGFGSSTRSSLFAREVHRCRTTQRWYTTINVPCLPRDSDDGVLLYAV